MFLYTPTLSSHAYQAKRKLSTHTRARKIAIGLYQHFCVFRVQKVVPNCGTYAYHITWHRTPQHLSLNIQHCEDFAKLLLQNTLL